MSTLTITSKALAYEDAGQTSNPSNVPVNWGRSIQGLDVRNPATSQLTLAGFESRTLIDGERTLSTDGTTALDLLASSLDPSRYRLKVSGGTDPVFRTKRVLNGNLQMSLVVNQNLSVTVTALSSATAFVNVQVGDTVFIPGVKTGDPTSTYNPLNCGYWTVLTRSNTVLILARATGEVFEAISETVTPAVPSAEFQVYSTTGVQVGDVVELGSAFSSSAQRAFGIVAVTQGWIEFISTSPLGAESGVLPGASGLVIHSASKRFLQVEADQDCVLRLNGDAGNTNLIQPWIAGTKGYAAEFRKVGPTWKLVVVNKSSAPLNLTVISAE